MLNYKKDNRKAGLRLVFDYLHRHIVAVIVIIAVVSGVIATVTIVQNREEAEKVEPGKITELAETDEIRLATYQPKSFNVFKSTDEDVYFINQLVYSSLFTLDDTLNVVPDAVESYETDPENGAVEITLRDDIYFSDGSALDAYDVNRSIDAIVAAGSKSPYYVYANKIDLLYIHDRKSFRLTFKKASDASLDNLVFPLVSDAEYEDGQRFAMGTGPYAYGDYEEGKELILEPNENYYKGEPALPIRITFVKDKTTIPGLMTMDAVTAGLFREPESVAIAEDKNLLCRPVTSGELEYLGFNFSNELLARQEIRSAIARSIDRDAIVTDDYGDAAVVSDSLYYPGFLGTDKANTIAFEPKEAADSLLAAGLVDSNEDGLLEDEKGEVVSFTLIVSKAYGSRVEAAYSIAEDLAAAGVEVEVVKLSADDFTSWMKSGKFDMLLGGIKMDKQFKMSQLLTKSNYIGYKDGDVFKQAAALERTLSNGEQLAAFETLKQSLNEQVPYLAICYRNYYFLSVDTFQSTGSPAWYDPFRGAANWSWKRKVTRNNPQNG